ncbi:hypothetical protein D9M71_686230 [compost metagenome]
MRADRTVGQPMRYGDCWPGAVACLPPARASGDLLKREDGMNKQACFSCGAPEGMVRFKDRSFEVTYQKLKREVLDLAGWECVVCVGAD